MKARRGIKRTAKNVTLILVSPLFLLYRLFSILGNKDGCFQSFSQFLSLMPGKTGIYFRAAFYRLACPNTSDEISVGFLTVLSHQDTTIEYGVYIGPQSNIGSCHIRKNTLIGSGVHILSGKLQHNFSDLARPIKEQGGEIRKIEIGEDCWIGNHSTILAPIMDKSIVSAASLVLKKVEPEVIVGGNPAKLIRSRNNESKSY